MKIIEAVDLIIGHAFRGAYGAQAGDDYLYLQPQNIMSDGTIDATEVLSIDLPRDRSRAMLRSGDVVITNRGNFRAAVFSELEKPAVAAASLIILRLRIETTMTPGYLRDFLNSEYAQRRLQRIAGGSVLKSLTKKQFSDFEIVIPSLEIQQKISNIKRNTVMRESMYRRKIQIYQQVQNQAISSLLTAYSLCHK